MLKYIKQDMKEIILFMASTIGKITWVQLIGVALMTFFLPIASIVHAVVILVLLDLVTGVAKSYRESDKAALRFSIFSVVTSHKLGKTLSKLLSYFILIIAAFVLGKFIIPVKCGVILAKSIASLIGVRELYSIGENVNQSKLMADFIEKIKGKI